MFHTVFEKGMQVIKTIEETQQKQIEEAAALIADSFVKGHHFYVSGSGHSHTVSEEFYGRAGGLAFVVPILTNELTMTDHPTKSSYIENLSGYAQIVGELYKIQKDDVVLIASNSGRNAYAVELALYAKKKGAKVIAITSLAHSTTCSSRASCGKRLFEIADIVIDNCGVIGDACLEVEGIETKMLPTSSMANAFIVGALTVLTASYIRESGLEVPVFESLNAKQKINRNAEYYETYTRVYMKE